MEQGNYWPFNTKSEFIKKLLRTDKSTSI